MTTRNIIPQHDADTTALSELTEGDSQTLQSVGYFLTRLAEMKEVTPEDRAEIERLITQLRYETRYKRLHLQERMYRLALNALVELEGCMATGDSVRELAVSAAQFRLLVKDYMVQTREEYGDRDPASIQQQQVNVIQRIVIQAPAGTKVIDGEIVDG